MKNRTLPYGYQCCNGIIVLHPQESEIVKWIILKKEDRKSKRSVGQIGRQAIIMRMRAERVIKAVDILKNGKF